MLTLNIQMFLFGFLSNIEFNSPIEESHFTLDPLETEFKNVRLPLVANAAMTGCPQPPWPPSSNQPRTHSG